MIFKTDSETPTVNFRGSGFGAGFALGLLGVFGLAINSGIVASFNKTRSEILAGKCQGWSYAAEFAGQIERNVIDSTGWKLIKETELDPDLRQQIVSSFSTSSGNPLKSNLKNELINRDISSILILKVDFFGLTNINTPRSQPQYAMAVTGKLIDSQHPRNVKWQRTVDTRETLKFNDPNIIFEEEMKKENSHVVENLKSKSDWVVQAMAQEFN